MSKTEKRILFVRRFAQLVQFAHIFDIHFIVTDFHRTASRQKELYDAGKSKCDGVNHRSKHQDWLAIDICIVNEDGALVWNRSETYEKLGKQWKALGGIWGGDWESLNDIYHFQAGESSEWYQD